mmetsp:Transcript_40899/g.52673  ORF Transcript_40899/g.52673 Transcript_40899/m.52673 type:complete len:492 (+) Transcript_40899:157-1632(+)
MISGEDENNDTVTIDFQIDDKEEEPSHILVQDLKSTKDQKNEKFLILMATLTLIFCILEGTIAILYSSLAMLSDAFHNLGDVAAIFIALYVQKKKMRGSSNPDYPFGYKRLEVLGGLVNSVFMGTVCIYIFLSAVPKIINPEELDATWTFIGVAATGICLNLLGVFLFSSANIPHMHAHSHGTCSHGHTSAVVRTIQTTSPELSHEVDVECAVLPARHSLVKRTPSKELAEGRPSQSSYEDSSHTHHSDAHHNTREIEFLHSHSHSPEHCHSHCNGHSHSHHHDEEEKMNEALQRSPAFGSKLGQRSNYLKLGGSHLEVTGKASHHSSALGHSHQHNHDHSQGGDSNIWAVFIHSLTDALSSALVVATGLIVHYFGKSDQRDGLDYLDTCVSLVMAGITVAAIWPLMKHSCHILMEGTPAHLNRGLLEKSLRKVPGVLTIDDLYIIQLNGEECFAAVQASCDQSLRNQVLGTVKQVFQMHGIRRSTVELYF